MKRSGRIPVGRLGAVVDVPSRAKLGEWKVTPYRADGLWVCPRTAVVQLW